MSRLAIFVCFCVAFRSHPIRPASLRTFFAALLISNLRLSIAPCSDCIPSHHLVALLSSKLRISVAQYSDCITSHSMCCYLDFELSTSRFRSLQPAIRFSPHESATPCTARYPSPSLSQFRTLFFDCLALAIRLLTSFAFELWRLRCFRISCPLAVVPVWNQL